MEGPKLLERATEVFGKTREFANDRAAHLKAFAHEKPLVVTLLGIGAGVVLGMLLAPRNAKVLVAIRTNGKGT